MFVSDIDLFEQQKIKNDMYVNNVDVLCGVKGYTVELECIDFYSVSKVCYPQEVLGCLFWLQKSCISFARAVKKTLTLEL